jgi:hypothetical protein
MKTLKSIMFGLVLLIASTAAKADKQNNAALTKNDVLDIYMNAIMHGKIENLDRALAPDVQYNMYRGEKTFKLNKDDILASFKASENVDQTCQCTTTKIEDNDKSMVIKLDMKYDNYVRTNIITIALNGHDWKITKIETHTS